MQGLLFRGSLIIICCNFFQIFLTFPAHNQSDIRQRVVVDEPIQFGTLLHGVRDRVFDGGRIDRKHKAIFIFDIHAGGVNVELAGYNSSIFDRKIIQIYRSYVFRRRLWNNEILPYNHRDRAVLLLIAAE